eukprot:SAG31_NODE_26690_length_438_cov_0.713864_1_plen_118_part_01
MEIPMWLEDVGPHYFPVPISDQLYEDAAWDVRTMEATAASSEEGRLRVWNDCPDASMLGSCGQWDPPTYAIDQVPNKISRTFVSGGMVMPDGQVLGGKYTTEYQDLIIAQRTGNNCL